MTPFMIPLVSSWLPFWTVYVLPFMGLAFLGFVFRFIHYLFRR